MILGHNHPAVRTAVLGAAEKGMSFGACTTAEVELAEELTKIIPSMDMVRLVNSGTEATMSAIRLARGVTRRDYIIKFKGNYHGHGDSFLIAAGSGALTHGVPSSPGVPAGTAANTLLADYNMLPSVEKLFNEYNGLVAAIIVEPVAGNMGCVPPLPGFLEGLRALCTEHGALLIFDEVMTGFRVALGGAQERFGIDPDLSTFGKIIGGGLFLLRPTVENASTWNNSVPLGLFIRRVHCREIRWQPQQDLPYLGNFKGQIFTRISKTWRKFGKRVYAAYAMRRE